MERDLVSVVPESPFKVQDRMGDVHSKDFKHSNSSQLELLQEGSKPSSPTYLKYPPALAATTNLIESRQDYPASTSSDSFSGIDIAVEALEDGEISNENKSISYVKCSNDLILPKGPNSSQPLFCNKSESPTTIQKIDSNENESTEEIQPPIFAGIESTEEIQPPIFAGIESTEEIQPPIFAGIESTEEMQSPIFAGIESTEENQLAPSVENESTKDIQPALAEETESTKVIQPYLSVETESTEEIKPPILSGTESTKVIQPVLSMKTESTVEIPPVLSVETESTEEIPPVIFMETESTEEIQLALSVENESNEEIQPFLSIETESTEENQLDPSVENESTDEIQLALSEENESTEEITPSLSVQTESTEEIQPQLFAATESTEKMQLAPSVENESTEEIQPVLPAEEPESIEKNEPDFSLENESTEVRMSALAMETESNEEILLTTFVEIESTDEIQSAFSVENEPTKETQQSEKTKSNQIKDPALSEEGVSSRNSSLSEETERIQALVSEDIASTIIMKQVIAEKPESTKSFQPEHSETKLAKVKEPVISDEFHLNEGIESHPLASSCNEKVISSPESLKSQIPSNDINPAVEPAISSKVYSEINLDSSNPEDYSNSSFPPAIDSESFLSLLNLEEYKNGSYFVHVNDKAGSGAQVIVTPTSPLPETIFPTLDSPPTDNFQTKSIKKQNRSSESIQTVDSLATKLTEVKQLESSEEVNLNDVMDFNSLVSKSIEKAISASQSKRSQIHSNGFDSSAAPEILSQGLSESSNSKDNSNSFPPVIDTESFFSLSNTDERKNGSHFGFEWGRYVIQSGGRMIVNPSTQLPKPNFPTYEVPPLSPSTERYLMEAIENLSSKISSYQANSVGVLKFSNPEEKSNSSVPPVSGNVQFDSSLNIRENGGKPFEMPGKGRMAFYSGSPCQPSSHNFEMLPSPPAKNPTKSTGNISPKKDVTIPTDICSTTCEPVCPNLEVPPLSPLEKNLPKPIIKNLSLSCNRLLAALLSRLADWIFRGMKKSAHFFEELEDNLINYFKRELENGVDLLKQMIEHVDYLLTAAEGLPDPNSILPYEAGSEKISIRDRLVSAGAFVLRKLEKMKNEVISEQGRFFEFCSNEGKLSIDGFLSTKQAFKAHDIIYRLYVKISELFLKLGMDVEKFRDHIRDFVFKIEILRKKDLN